jgi:tetratricopeptide (TPR) repeat protein
MKTYRTVTMIGSVFLTASLALAQVAPQTPPSAPTPPAQVAAPRPPTAPVARPTAPHAPDQAAPQPAPAPAPPRPAPDRLDQAAPRPAPAPAPRPAVRDAPEQASPRPAQDRLDQAAPIPAPEPFPADLAEKMARAAELARQGQMDLDISAQEMAQKAAEKAMEKSADAMAKVHSKLADVQLRLDGLTAPLAMQMGRMLPRGSEDGVYQSGLNHIDAHQYDQALTDFNNVISHTGAHAEGAFYWKAYVLNKLGRSADAQAAIDTLRKTYPNSRWLDDANALELEVKQSKGPVSPESETDEEIKILALNGLMQVDPEKALPQVENMLKSSHSPKLQSRVLYVIAESDSPQAQQDLERIARGGNPDLQARAIQFLAQRPNANNGQLLVEIYAASNDPAVKTAVLAGLAEAKDKDRLLQVVRTEKDPKMRAYAINRLGYVDGQPELWQLYQGETTTEGKTAILTAMQRNGNLDKLAEVARTDKDPKVRQTAIRAIASQQTGTPSATLVSLYGSEQDPKVKQAIIDTLSGSRNCKPLVEVAKAEKDLQLKVRIVERLSGMTKSCREATDYLTELLDK